MGMPRVLVLGGYGVFGRRAVERLVQVPGLEVIVAGRNLASAEAIARELGDRTAGAKIVAARLDAMALTGRQLRELGITVVLNAAGPYQGCDYRVAEAAIEARAHYVDLADARGFVVGIETLDARARASEVLVVSGASSVPALAAAVIDNLLPRFSRFTELEYGISPGNSFDPGEATVASILGNAGQPFKTLTHGHMEIVHGWQPLRRHSFQDRRVGTRWLGHCDVPDLDLFPPRYPSLETHRFLAGVEVSAFQYGIWVLSWLVRAGLLRRPERLGKLMLSAKRRFSWLGSDRGAMFVSMRGSGLDGQQLQVCWELIANSGHGPYIPTTPAVILVRQLASGMLRRRGAVACVGLITLADFTREVSDLNIGQSLVIGQCTVKNGHQVHR